MDDGGPERCCSGLLRPSRQLTARRASPSTTGWPSAAGGSRIRSSAPGRTRTCRWAPFPHWLIWQDASQLERLTFPTLGEKALRSITRDDVSRWYDACRYEYRCSRSFPLSSGSMVHGNRRATSGRTSPDQSWPCADWCGGTGVRRCVDGGQSGSQCRVGRSTRRIRPIARSGRRGLYLHGDRRSPSCTGWSWWLAIPDPQHRRTCRRCCLGRSDGRGRPRLRRL